MSETDHFPALSQLEGEFNEHMRDFRAGIETSEDLVYWLQRVSVLTLGRIEDGLLVDLFTESVANAILLGHPAVKPRRDPRTEDLETDADVYVRCQLESGTFTPAFRRAYRNLKSNANEYIDEESATAASDDAPPALRPALQELSTRQRDVLDDMFQKGGFSTRSEVSEWSRDVIAATRANISDDQLRDLTMVHRAPNLQAALLGQSDLDPRTKQNFLQMTASVLFLPLFNKATRELAQTAGEMADDGDESSTDTVGV